MKLTIDQALHQSSSAHREGKIEEAERLYHSILQSQPSHPDANHNLGVLYVSLNKSERALPLFKTSLKVNPNIEQFWISYISALIKVCQFTKARQTLKKAKRNGINKNKLNALNMNLRAQVNGLAASYSDEIEGAYEGMYSKYHVTDDEVTQESLTLSSEAKSKDTIKEDNNLLPSNLQLQNLLEQYQTGRYDEAEKLAILLTQQFPHHQFGWKVLGIILGQTGRQTEALKPNKIAYV